MHHYDTVAGMSTKERTEPSVAASASPRLISDALVNYSGLVVSAVVGILLVPLMLSRLGTVTYGLWLAAVTVAATLRAFDFGLGLVVTREVAAASGKHSFWRVAPLVSAAGGAHVLLGMAGAGVIVAGAAALAEPLKLPEGSRELVLPVFALVGLAFVAEQCIGFVQSVLMGLRRYWALNVLTIALVLLRAAGIVALLLLGYSLLGVGLWYAAATAAVAVAGFMALLFMPGRFRVGVPGRHWRSLRSHAAFGLASFTSIAAAGIMWQALPLLAALLLGAGAVVAVHVGQRIPLVLTSVYGRLAAVVFPAASEYKRTNDLAATQAVLRTGTRLVLHLMIPVLVVGLLAAPDLFSIWLGGASDEIVLIFQLTLVAVFADAIGSLAINVLWGRGQVAPVLAVSLVSTAIVILGGVLLMPGFGVTGGVTLLAIVLAVASAVFWTVACRETEVRPLRFFGDVGSGIALPALGCLITAALAQSLPLPHGARLVATGALGTLAYLRDPVSAWNDGG
jgi:O-antigen/teichoic acid export membrane protein